MNRTISPPHEPPRVRRLKVRNFRALREIEIRDLTPMTVLLGPNGSGKSTVFDVFAFLSECFATGLRRAWDRRGRARELRTRDAEGPMTIELQYRERPRTPLITYHLEVDERGGAPVVVHEWLRWKRGRYGAPFRFLEYQRGLGRAISGESPDAEDQRREIPLKSPDLLAVNALGQFQDHPRVAALRDFIMGWHVSYLSADSVRSQPEAGPQERLTTTGDNLANVVQYLSEQHPSRIDAIFETLRRRVPRVERVLTEAMPDGRLLLQIKDAPFSHPVLARFASDGTLKMLAYLVLLYDPDPPPFVGIEEPENFLHPRLLLRAGGGVPRGFRTHAVARHYPFAVLPGHVEAGGSPRAVARRSGPYPGAAGRRSGQRPCLYGRRRFTRRSLDGGAVRRGRSAVPAWRSIAR